IVSRKTGSATIHDSRFTTYDLRSMPVAITLHILSAVVWVGGMFFAWMALRPVAASLLEQPLRLPLWSKTFARFFPWVWTAVILLPASGYWMIFEVFEEIGRASWRERG